MNIKTLCFAIITLLVICSNVYGKKIKKNKRPKDQDQLTTIKPNVVAYSTFGFNDVSSYDGFVPTSPEYSSFLTGMNQESSTRLYAPAFPSAADTTGYRGNFNSQPLNAQNYGISGEGNAQSGMSQFPSDSMNFPLNSNPAYNADQNENSENEDSNKPVYGTKISNKQKQKNSYNINNSASESSNSEYSKPSDGKYFDSPETEHKDEKPALSESNVNYQNNHNYQVDYAPNQDMYGFNQPDVSNTNSGLNFPRVVDFTKLSSNTFPTALDTSKLISNSMKHSNTQMAMAHSQILNSYGNMFNNNNNFLNNGATALEQDNINNSEGSNNNNILRFNTISEPDFTNKHVAAHHKYSEPSFKQTEHKRQKPWGIGNNSNIFKDYKDSSSSSTSNVKGYTYSTNYSNMNFKYGISEPKKPFNPDELLPASSNVVDYTSYHFPKNGYDNFKKMPEYNKDEEDLVGSLTRNKYKPADYPAQYKNTLNEELKTSSHWGSLFKPADYSSSLGDRPKKTLYNTNDDDVVNIPKRPHKLLTKLSEWPPNHYRSQKGYKPSSGRTKDLDKYKSEEDLLGLRTRDTSHPFYTPTYKQSINMIDNNEYDNFKQLVEKWKESYIKSKYKDARDNAEYWSNKPVPKLHSIKVPHPVLVPVPHPFPVQVPISKPVAVPVLKEITVPIEKPMPYPVYKNVPYPVEKLVPVPVQKEVAVPVEKPYPVHIPYVRPVFHHTKPVYEDSEQVDEDEYPRQSESRKPSQYRKRQVSGQHNRTRRPSRATYQDRNRRRWPERRRPSSYNTPDNEYARPQRYPNSGHYRHHDFEQFDEDEHDRYVRRCRRIGNC